MDIPNSADNFVLNVGTMLANPIQNSSLSNENRKFATLCPWCGVDCLQAHIKAGFLQKDLFKCIGCEQLTSKCVNFASCAGAAKGSFVWDEKLCPKCDQSCDQGINSITSIQDFFCEIPCGVIFTNERQKPIAKDCDHNVRRVSLKYHLDQSIPFPLAKHVRKLSTIAIEFSIKQNFFEPDFAASATGATPMESWKVVRDAVLCWPGPERADVARFEELCAHGAFARRWLAASGGDEARAVQRILAHLRWRREYAVDSIEDEVWPHPPHAGPPQPHLPAVFGPRRVAGRTRAAPAAPAVGMLPPRPLIRSHDQKRRQG